MTIKLPLGNDEAVSEIMLLENAVEKRPGAQLSFIPQWQVEAHRSYGKLLEPILSNLTKDENYKAPNTPDL